MWRWGLAALTACSFEPPTMACSTPPRALFEVNSAAEDRSPWLSDDGLELHFSSNRSGDSEIYRAVRGSRSEAFSMPAIVPSLSAPDLDFDPVVSRDGLTAWTFREHPTFLQLFTSKRAHRDDAWGPATPVTDIEGRHPSFTADMLTVYTASLHLTPTEDIFVATRTSTSCSGRRACCRSRPTPTTKSRRSAPTATRCSPGHARSLPISRCASGARRARMALRGDLAARRRRQ